MQSLKSSRIVFILMACGQFQFPDARFATTNLTPEKHDVTLHESQMYVNVLKTRSSDLNKSLQGEQISGYQKISASDMMGDFELWFCGRRPGVSACQQQQTPCIFNTTNGSDGETHVMTLHRNFTSIYSKNVRTCHKCSIKCA